ncbi:biotin-dependent carboxyltransferase family protein [Secundilactobacillus folii]|uniref:5-oxoprolinase/urea amidolyase family protein n=1 Tax=Secundilactobacillus folii TaxID=2678357 RepID=A0A7X2XU29_9LACO|nr:biotin-dependent carboxyltransferase family protein [Secundilactobacillus folii]MTV81579.1 5-oxoprolinase/urea amidolyase family protein [Secundilactobacillus folii]
MALKIISAGPITTVQDQGRTATQSSGFSVSGVMDFDAAGVANLLVGNDLDDAVVESSLQGPTLTFTQSSHFAITGATANLKLNGQPINAYRSYFAHRGDQLVVGHYSSGRFGYLAVTGGIQVPIVMGSRSTSLKYHLGGYDGRQLQSGDVLQTIRDEVDDHQFQQATPYSYVSDAVAHIRVTAGPQYQDFPEQYRQQFVQHTFEMSQQSDRMGARLHGTPIDTSDVAEMLSEGTVFGGIQIPNDGQPIVLLADRQTTGGYPVIGVVARVDLPKLVQLSPGQQIRFQWISTAQSQDYYRQNYGSSTAIKQVHHFKKLADLDRGPANRIALLFDD